MTLWLIRGFFVALSSIVGYRIGGLLGGAGLTGIGAMVGAWIAISLFGL